MTAANQDLVIVVDDDLSVREALDSLFRSVGLRTLLYGSVAEFLAAKLPDVPCCLVLDVRLPGQSGLDLQAALVGRQAQAPIVFITGHADVPMSVRAMKAGAIEFLPKPFRDQDLLDAVQLGLSRDKARRDAVSADEELRRKYRTLTPREQEVMAHVVRGSLNKQIAAAIDVSEVTVKVHRGQVMRKMGARSLADLVRMADRLTVACG